MNRARTATRLRQALVPARAAAVALVALGVVLAACGPAARGSGEPAGATSPTASAPGPSSTHPNGAPIVATAAPRETPAATPGPSGRATATPAIPEGAAACSGSAGNRDFFEAATDAVDWPVYCAVLPDGWFIESGNYRLRGGGQVVVAYRGPEGARFELHEGAFCGDDGGCLPSGSSAGDARFGDRAGELYRLDGGGLAVVVDRGEETSWLAIGGNLDEATFLAYAAALHRVG